MAEYAAAVDQGTTSTRFMVFDHSGQVVSVDQKEHEQIYPKPGWVEHDPLDLVGASLSAVRAALSAAGLRSARDVARRVRQALEARWPGTFPVIDASED